MSKRRSIASKLVHSNNNVTEKEHVTFPEICLVCDNQIQNNSVLFHCECIVALCKDCAIAQVAFQPFTFYKGRYFV